MNGSFSLRFVFYRLVLGASLAYGMPATAADWTITNLGTLGGDSYAFDINARGQVVGYSFISGDLYHAFLFDGVMRDLGTLGGTSSEAKGINIRGQVVGESFIGGDIFFHAFLYDGVAMRDLGTLGGSQSHAFGINAGGQVAGYSNTSDDFASHAFLYDGAMRDLGTLGGTDSLAFNINASGQVVGGSSMTGDFAYHAFLFDGVMRDLGTLGGSASGAYSINSGGQVAGASNTSGDATYHAFMFDGVMRDLGTLGGSYSEAYSINERGRVVGTSLTSGEAAWHAFLYNNGAMRDLSTLPEVVAAGWQSLDYAGAINDSGQIVGAGVIGGQTRAFRLHPQTTSRYMTTVDSVTLFNLGCAQTHQNGLLILDFGQPWYNGTSYGTIFPNTNTFVPISDIEAAVRYFLNGYYVCGGRGFMTVGVGTNNYGIGTTFSHAQAWGQMMARLNAFVSGANLGDRLAVVGASDIEIGWNTPTNSRAWVDGYSGTSPVSYYNYGDAQGCPTSGTGPCDNGWSQEDVWYVSWGSPANPLPVPEIYFNVPPGPPTQARRWATLATLYGTPMTIPGVLTQWAACNDVVGGCNPPTNTPVQAWYQMVDALYAVIPDPNTVQNILYSSDITWQN